MPGWSPYGSYRMQGSDRKQTSHPARRVSVMLPYPFPAPFDYRVPADLDPQPGDVVLVPLNRREELGVVWESTLDDEVPDHKLKPVAGVIDTPPMLETTVAPCVPVTSPIKFPVKFVALVAVTADAALVALPFMFMPYVPLRAFEGTVPPVN